EQLEHVVEERDAGRDLVAPAAVEPERQLDVRLLGLARDRSGAAAMPRRSATGTNWHQRRPPMAASRCSTARPCASSPSRRASRTTAGPSRAMVRGVASMTLVRFMKSYTPRGDAKRAVPPVGRTWFGPAR